MAPPFLLHIFVMRHKGTRVTKIHGIILYLHLWFLGGGGGGEGYGKSQKSASTTIHRTRFTVQLRLFAYSGPERDGNKQLNYSISMKFSRIYSVEQMPGHNNTLTLSKDSQQWRESKNVWF